MVRYYVLAKGRVQGVGFRFFVQMNATFLNLTGYVRNLYDGSVEIEIQGPESSVTKLLETVASGNRFIKITSLEKNEIPLSPSEKKFVIK